MTKHRYGYLFAFITVLIWSSTFIITKVVLDYISPIQILTVRIAIAIGILYILYPKRHHGIHWQSELLFALSGLGLGLYFIFENTALDLTYPSNVGLLVALSPIFTAALVSISEKKSYFIPKNIIGLMLAFIGVFFVEFGKDTIELSFLGDMLAILAGLMFSVYTLFLSRVTTEFHIIEKTRKVFIYVLVTFLLYALLFGENLIWATVELKPSLGVLYLAIVASSLAFLLWNKAITIIGTFKTNIFIYLIPVMTMIISSMLLEDTITLYKSIGTAIIIIGLYISEKE